MKRPIGRNKPEGKELIEGFDTPQLHREDEKRRERYFCYCASAGSPIHTNLQLYSLQKAADDWNDLVGAIAERGVDSAGKTKERLAFILSCLGLSLSQLLGQNTPSSRKAKMDQPRTLLHHILARSHVDRTTKRRLDRTFQDFLLYYDSVRHFGKTKDKKTYQTIEKLTPEKLDRFRRMTIEIWDTVIAIHKDDPRNELDNISPICKVVFFKEFQTTTGS